MPEAPPRTVLTGSITALGANEHGPWVDARMHDTATGRDFEVRLSGYQLPVSQQNTEQVGQRIHVTLPEGSTVADGAEALAASRVRLVGKLGAMAREDILAQTERLRRR